VQRPVADYQGDATLFRNWENPTSLANFQKFCRPIEQVLQNCQSATTNNDEYDHSRCSVRLEPTKYVALALLLTRLEMGRLPASNPRSTLFTIMLMVVAILPAVTLFF
jgi:hypothetical protein